MNTQYNTQNTRKHENVHFNYFYYALLLCLVQVLSIYKYCKTSGIEVIEVEFIR